METHVALNGDGTVAAWGPEVAGGWMLLPDGDPFSFRWDGQAWKARPAVELPVTVSPLQQQIADLQAQVADVVERLEELL